MAKHVPRVLESTNIHQGTPYIEIKYEYLCQHNVFERVRHLSLPGNRHCFAERLDKDVLDASLAAEKKIARFGEPQWSVALATAGKQAQAIQKQLSMLKTGISNEETLLNKLRITGLGDTLATSTHECYKLLREVKKNIAAIVNQSFSRREQERQQKIESLMQSVPSYLFSSLPLCWRWYAQLAPKRADVCGSALATREGLLTATPVHLGDLDAMAWPVETPKCKDTWAYSGNSAYPWATQWIVSIVLLSNWFFCWMYFFKGLLVAWRWTAFPYFAAIVPSE